MPRDRRRRDQPSPDASPSSRTPTFIPPFGVGFLTALVVLLNVPSLGLGYFWDDFYFLTTSGPGRWVAHLLPQPGATFYRPIPLGLEFGLLRLLDPVTGVLGHAVNLALLGATALLLAQLVARLANPRAGLYTGLFFASLAALPALGAWVSGSQDLFAIFFVLLALRLRHEGRDLAALACAAAALLCKESAIAALPALVLWNRILGRPERRPWLPWVGFGALAIAWASIHPGIHLLAGRGFQSGATSYVGLEHSERWPLYLVRYVATSLNLPPPGLQAVWWPERAIQGGAALVALAVGFMVLEQRRTFGGGKAGAPAAALPSPIAILGGLIALPALLMPSVLVRHWAPYFACFPAVGVAMAAGPVLARHKRIAPAALALYLVLGIAVRGVEGRGELVMSERAMVAASSGMGDVRAKVRKLLPTIPKGTQVVAAFGTEGLEGIQSAMVEGQAMSLWYGDPTLTTVTALERRAGAPAEILLRVSRDRDVLVIEGDSLAMRTTAEGPPPIQEFDRLVSNYARAVAAGGDTDRAIALMKRLGDLEPAETRPYHRRVIASFLLAAGRRGAADSILAATDSFPSEMARQLVWRLQAEATSNERLDEAAFEAFGLHADDPAAIRWMMRQFRQTRAAAQAAWFARRLETLLPGDSEAADILARVKRAGIEPSRKAPPPLARAR